MKSRKITKGQERQYARMFVDRFRNTCAITVDTPKTSALVFDKVYASNTTIADAPLELITYQRGSTLQGFPAMSLGGPLPEQRQVTITVRERKNAPHALVSAPTRDTLLYLLNRDAGKLCTSIADTGHHPILCYSRLDEDNQTFRAGDYGFIIACVRNLGVVDEAQLTWEQVLEFRKDPTSRADVARFLYWLDTAMNGKSKAEIQDRVSRLCERNQGALSKFGIYTSSISESLLALGEERITKMALAVGAGFLAGGALWAALVAGIVLTGTTAVALRRAKSDIDSSTDATAFVHSVERLASPNPDALQGAGPVSFSGDKDWLF